MGSAFTGDGRAMRVVMEVVKEKDMFFLDSITTPETVAGKIALEYGVPLIKRDIFLDNQEDAVYIKKQWKRAIRIARKRGYAIVLAHPKKATLEFLKSYIPKQEVDFILLTDIVKSR
jgi:hypothetical protein